MPELPEVETVMRGMEPVMTGNIISSVQVRKFDLRVPIPRDFASVVEGRKVSRLERRGKYILVFLRGGQGFVLHLGMSGRVLIVPPDQDYDLRKHDHVIFTMQGGARIVFNDARRFGMLFLITQKNWHSHKAFAAMGPEPLSDDFTASVLAARLKGKSAPIKAALLDQNVVAGVGNIYACEALHMAGISPFAKASSVQGARAKALVSAVRSVLRKAILAGGSTLRDHRRADGELGYFQYHFLTYDREGEPCPRCADPVKKPAKTKAVFLKRAVQSGRSTFYCSACQT